MAILNSIGEVIYDWDLLSDALIWGPNARAVLALSAETPIDSGRDFAALASAESVESRQDTILNSDRNDRGNGVTYQVRYGLLKTAHARPTTLWVEDTGRWFAGADGRPARAHGLLRVLTAQYESERDVLMRSHFDPLTGCINRAHFMDVLSNSLGRLAQSSDSVGLLLIAMEDLSALNKTYGYDAVDELIAGVATILRSQIRGTDFLARYGGNKFALVLHGADTDRLEPAARRILDLAARSPITTAAGALGLNLRVGGVIAPRHGRAAHALLHHAEQALDGARQPGAPAFVAFDPTIPRGNRERRLGAAADEVVAALNEGRVAIALQPIVAAADGQVVMMEALLRLRRRDGSILGPEAVLPIAEAHDLIDLLDRRVLDLVVARLSQSRLTLSMNLSHATWSDPEWCEQVAALERLHPGMGRRLVFEILEAEAAADLERACDVAAALRKTGARIAIDHFGAGHLTPHALRRLSPDYLKIDGAFVQNLSRSPDDRFMVRTLISVARHVETALIAEWVENAEIARILGNWGVHYLQGLHFGAPEILDDQGASPARNAVA